MTPRGQFITFEGQDGAGKSTNIAVVREQLQSLNIEFIETREPGGTSFGESIRALILNSDDQSFGDKTELLLMFAARAEHIERVIEPALARGAWVLCDRFTDASYAYQGGGRRLNINDIETLEQLVQGKLRPNLTILFDLPIEVGEQRTNARAAQADANYSADRFEQQKLDFKQRVREAYLAIAKKEPSRMKVIDASQTLAGVERDVSETLENFIAGSNCVSGKGDE